jgi:Skp family chaperone for outer membrane proteins
VTVAVFLVQMVGQRADLFSVFLVIPTGFLRALASKQVQLDEDDDSDNDSDIGELQGDAPQQQQQQEKQETQKVGNWT